MTTITLYWSNICVLHRWEKQHLEQVAKLLAAQGIDLRVRHFGIGYPTRMAETLARPDAELPDLIVSTDLEVFEDRRIFDRFRSDLHDLKALVPLKAGYQEHALNAWPDLLPFLVIPLVFCTNGAYTGSEPISYEEVLERSGVAFGGAGNSAARAVIKTLWDRYGKERTLAFADRSVITQMPVGSFQNVRTGGNSLGIVPSIYAKSANGVTLRRHYPAEGAIALPSYIAAHKKAPPDVVRQVLGALLTREFCDYFVRDGSLCCPLEGTLEEPWVGGYGTRLLYPTQAWFENIAPEAFERAYEPLVRARAAGVS